MRNAAGELGCCSAWERLPVSRPPAWGAIRHRHQQRVDEHSAPQRAQKMDTASRASSRAKQLFMWSLARAARLCSSPAASSLLLWPPLRQPFGARRPRSGRETQGQQPMMTGVHTSIFSPCPGNEKCPPRRRRGIRNRRGRSLAGNRWSGAARKRALIHSSMRQPIEDQDHRPLRAPITTAGDQAVSTRPS